MRRLLILLAIVPSLLQAQAWVADSVVKLNRAGNWDAAADFAISHLATAKPGDERCALLIGAAYAAARAGATAPAHEALTQVDSECGATQAAKTYAADLASARTALDEAARAAASLPPIPKTGVDFTGVDAFWPIADVLMADREPTEEQWRQFLGAPVYQIALNDVPHLRHDMEVAFRPSLRAARDSVVRTGRGDAGTVAHLATLPQKRAQLALYRTALESTFQDTLAAAEARTSKFLAPGARMTLPYIAFGLFTPDGFSEENGIVIDLQQASQMNMTLFLAHELNHSFNGSVDRSQASDIAPDAELFHAIRQLRNEGIADQVDKPHPYVAASPAMANFAELYNKAYDATPERLHTLDSLLAVVADHPDRVGDVGAAAARLLPMGSHPNGAYMAREIVETFGVDSLMSTVPNPFAFIRLYSAAELQRGHPAPFSSKAIQTLDAMEREHMRR